MYIFKLSVVNTSKWAKKKKKEFISGFEQLTDHKYHQETIEEWWHFSPKLYSTNLKKEQLVVVN